MPVAAIAARAALLHRLVAAARRGSGADAGRGHVLGLCGACLAAAPAGGRGARRACTEMRAVCVFCLVRGARGLLGPRAKGLAQAWCESDRARRALGRLMCVFLRESKQRGVCVGGVCFAG